MCVEPEIARDREEVLDQRLAEPGWSRREPKPRDLVAAFREDVKPRSEIECRIVEARRALRGLIAAGELDHDDMSHHWLMTALGDEED